MNRTPPPLGRQLQGEICKHMKKHLTTVFLILIFLAGVSLLLYPTLSDYWNTLHASAAVTAYTQQVENLDDERYEKMLSDAREYNRSLLTRENAYLLSPEQAQRYESLLNLDDSGIMGSIEIPNIDVSLPIYHGTEDSVLQIAVGHLEWTSLPVGGESTHCVLSGHRGLPSARLFTNLDKLSVGDTFVLRVLNEKLTYEITEIRIVEPTDTEALTIREGEDLCTLVTCTPYGINTHRLLVCGRRTENAPEDRPIHVVSDAVQIEPLLIAPAVAAPVLLALVILLLTGGKKRRDRNEE